MKRIILLLSLVLVPSVLAAQTSLDDQTAQAFIQGTEKVARKMVSAAFVPFTDYSRGEVLTGGALGYTRIDKVWTDPEITGDNLTGISLGGGAGYALTDQLALYAVADFLSLDGRFSSTFYGSGETGGSLNFLMGNIFAGAGYDFIKRGPFSLPLYLGLHCSAYSLNAALDEETISGSAVESSLSAGGLTPGISGGLAGEARVGKMILGGYFLYMADFTGLSGEAEIKADGVTLPGSYAYETDAYSGSTFGLSLKYSPAKKWTVGLDFSDFLPFGEQGDSAAEMSTLAFTVSYRS